jgi:mRNA interferase RelE/StbE
VKLLVDRSFERDSKRLPISVQKQLRGIIQKLTVAATLHEFDAIKMKGANNAYRIRFGNYRIGIYIDGDNLVLSRILDRKEIYKYFPKR